MTFIYKKSIYIITDFEIIVDIVVVNDKRFNKRLAHLIGPNNYVRLSNFSIIQNGWFLLNCFSTSTFLYTILSWAVFRGSLPV